MVSKYRGYIFEEGGSEDPEERLRWAIERVHAEIRNLSRSSFQYQGMGTTLSVIISKVVTFENESSERPAELFRGRDGAEMVQVPTGELWMGSPDREFGSP